MTAMSEVPIWSYPRAAAQIAVREGIPADTAYQVLSALGAGGSREDFGRLYGQEVRRSQMVGATSLLPLDQLPGSDAIQTMSTVTSTGYLYQVNVTATDTETGETFQIPHSIRVDYLIEPGEAIDSSIIEQTLRSADYNFEVQFAQLTGIFELTPEMAA